MPSIMEILSPHIFSVLSTTNKHSIIIYTTKNPRNFRASAHLVGRRKSHLRKKLIEQQVLPSISIESPIDDQIRSNSDDSLVGFNQDEILATTRIEPEPFVQDNANLLSNEVPNSSIAKLVNSIGKPKLTRVGVSVFCVFLVFIAFDRLFRKRNEKEEFSGLEKEMLRRKIKARMAKQKASLEVIQDSKDPEPEPEMMTRPQLDKEELMDSIVKLDKIQEIRAMARHAREMESNGESIDDEPDDVLLPQADVSIQDSSNNKQQPYPVTIPPIAKLGHGSRDSSDVEGKESNLFDKGVKLRIISSVKEAKEYLHNKEKKQEPEINNLHEVPKPDSNDDVFGNSTQQSLKDTTSLEGDGDALINNANSKDECVKGSGGDLGRANREKWIEDNFHEFEPLVEKIRGGFRNNYMVARENVKKDMDLVLELERDDNESEFEWMKDEKLREIVFQVRENELMGRDPFYLMDAQDKALFFKGLEEKVEKENEKLAHLHEYLHSNIENLDYGADGISLYDSPEKIIPRWKGPPPTTTISQEFLDNYLDQRKTLFAETLGNLDLDLQYSSNGKVVTNKQANGKVVSKSSKTVIEGSDGSVKPGKKSGKEFWQHTKKWSRGFIDSYNAENDPETKAAMKDIGKDLDKWITEKEIQEAADVMDKVPDKGKKFIAERINKLKKEMELFGPEAVVRKYSEYGDEEEIDYYWWLDLPHLLCIEIYIDERIGFYSLEMASDLELDPKPHHIIAFEDAGDCKNLCYLIQTHMETLGNGNAFIVPQMPKDTYREAKENGFNVTVIRKGELKLDVDQTLEEVEEKIVEIGSKMYHDQIMKSRNVNVDSVMKGVFGPKRRRLKRPTK